MGNLQHGELADGGHHLAREVLEPRLEVVDLLGELERGLAALDGLLAQLLGEVRDLVEDELLLQQL